MAKTSFEASLGKLLLLCNGVQTRLATGLPKSNSILLHRPWRLGQQLIYRNALTSRSQCIARDPVLALALRVPREESLRAVVLELPEDTFIADYDGSNSTSIGSSPR